MSSYNHAASESKRYKRIKLSDELEAIYQRFVSANYEVTDWVRAFYN